jgi:hypothetical protein
LRVAMRSWRWIRRRSSCSAGPSLTRDLLGACPETAETRGQRGKSSPCDSLSTLTPAPMDYNHRIASAAFVHEAILNAQTPSV